MKSRILLFLERFASPLILLSGLLLLSGCETGESAFRRGDFAEAARVSADRLARKPENEKAAAIFLSAYPQARAEWLGRARQALENTSDPFRWERALSAYEVLQGLSSRAALTPFAKRTEIEVVYYHTEIEQARANAANGRIQYADALMEEENLYKAREAYDHYLAAMRFAGQRDDISQMAEAARRAGTLVVGVDPVQARGHSLNPASMMMALMKELESHPPHGFVAFVPSGELGEMEAHQFLELSIGEVAVERHEAEVGQKAYKRELIPPVPAEEPFEVEATVFKREKRFELSCPARARVFEGAGWEPVLDRELPGRSSWSVQWEVLKGDPRALNGRELQLSEPPDPEHAKLMQQLAEALAAQARDVLASYY